MRETAKKKPKQIKITNQLEKDLVEEKFGRARNFEDWEATILARSWKNCSENAVDGADMKAKRFWPRVLAAYSKICCNEGRGDPSYRGRTWQNLQSYWLKTLQRRVGKFAASYCRVKNMSRSGWNDADYIKAAINNYSFTNNGEKFTLVDAWSALKDYPKFFEHVSPNKLEMKEMVDMTVATDTTVMPESETPLNQINVIMGITEQKRPIGSKKQKELNRVERANDLYQHERLNERKKTNEALMSLAKHNADMAQTYAESVRLQKEQADNQKMQAQIQGLIAMGLHDQAKIVMNQWLGGNVGDTTTTELPSAAPPSNEMEDVTNDTEDEVTKMAPI